MNLQQVADLITRAATELQDDDQASGVDFDYAVGLVLAEQLVPYLGIMDNPAFIDGITDVLEDGGFAGN